jgi:hypothetical protein
MPRSLPSDLALALRPASRHSRSPSSPHQRGAEIADVMAMMTGV